MYSRTYRAQYWWYLRDRFEDTYNAVERGIYADPDKLISLNSEMPSTQTVESRANQGPEKA